MELRPYQHDLVNEAMAALGQNEVPCVVAPTGAGKTVILAEIVRQLLERGEKVLIGAHRLEIIKQITKSLHRHLGEMPQLITANTTTPLQRVTVAMIPTLTRRRRWIERMAGRAYLLDEAHHQPAPSYVRLREVLNPSRFLGVTATPITPTGGGLGRHFDRLILGPEPRWLMDNGFLCDYRLYGAPAEIDTAGISTRGGDYALDELEDRVQAIAGNVLRDWHRFNPKGLSTITVGLSVEHAHQLAELYRAAGITAVAVDGKTPPGERERIFDAFRSGGITVLCACAVVDEGLDVPEASCLQLLRPTRSIRLYRQLIGRVLRPADEKGHAIIIDHGGSWRDLPLPDEHIPWSLEERVRTPRAENRNVNRDEECIVAKRPQIAIEDHRPLVLINGRTEQAVRAEAAKRSLRKMLGLVRRGIVPVNALYNQLHNARYFDDGELMALQIELNMPDSWAEQQGWLNAVS